MAHITNIEQVPADAREEILKWLPAEEIVAIIQPARYHDEYHVVGCAWPYNDALQASRARWTYVFCWKMGERFSASVDVNGENSPDNVFKRLALRMG